MSIIVQRIISYVLYARYQIFRLAVLIMTPELDGYIYVQHNPPYCRIVLTPLLIYFTLSSPGMRLRMRERTSMLLVTDIFAAFNIALCCLFADYVYFTEPNNTLLKMVFGMASAFILCLYLSRVKAMFYLIVPAVFAINAVMFTFWNVGILIGILMTFLMPLPYCMITFNHPYYFGFGRVKVKGVYRRYPEAVAKRIRAKQAEERKAERCERIRQGSKRF